MDLRFTPIVSLCISVTGQAIASVAFFENDVHLTKSGLKRASLVGAT